MDKLIQTKDSSIIYGEFKGEKNEELFRCPRELDELDLARYINENRALVAPTDSDHPFVDDDTEDLREVAGKKLVGYWRMYFRSGWAGRWLLEGDERPTAQDCAGVNKIIDWFCETFKKGCDWEMEEYFRSHFQTWGEEERYLIRPFMSDIYKIMVDTRYGNGDYPVRVYVYRKDG